VRAACCGYVIGTSVGYCFGDEKVQDPEKLQGNIKSNHLKERKWTCSKPNLRLDFLRPTVHDTSLPQMDALT